MDCAITTVSYCNGIWFRLVVCNTTGVEVKLGCLFLIWAATHSRDFSDVLCNILYVVFSCIKVTVHCLPTSCLFLILQARILYYAQEKYFNHVVHVTNVELSKHAHDTVLLFFKGYGTLLLGKWYKERVFPYSCLGHETVFLLCFLCFYQEIQWIHQKQKVNKELVVCSLYSVNILIILIFKTWHASPNKLPHKIYSMKEQSMSVLKITYPKKQKTHETQKLWDRILLLCRI